MSLTIGSSLVKIYHLVSDVDKGGGHACVRVVYGKCLYFPRNFVFPRAALDLKVINIKN